MWLAWRLGAVTHAGLATLPLAARWQRRAEPRSHPALLAAQNAPRRASFSSIVLRLLIAAIQ
jgi:hypothetical protein